MSEAWVKKYIVRLSNDERSALEALISKGQHPAATIVKARILLMISGWKRQAMGGLSSVFSGRAQAKDAVRDGEVEKLHAKIGQLLVERDFLAKASGR